MQLLKITPEIASLICASSSRCTQATLRSFGIDAWPEFASGVIGHLHAGGFHTLKIELPEMTVAQFLKLYTEGKYIVFTSDHVFAIHNGIPVDTAHGRDNKRICVESAWLVWRPAEVDA